MMVYKVIVKWHVGEESHTDTNIVAYHNMNEVVAALTKLEENKQASLIDEYVVEYIKDFYKCKVYDLLKYMDFGNFIELVKSQL